MNYLGNSFKLVRKFNQENDKIKSSFFKKKYDFLRSGNIIKIHWKEKKQPLKGLILKFSGKNIYSYKIKLLIKVINDFLITNIFLNSKNIKSIDCMIKRSKSLKSHCKFIENYFISRPKKNKKVLLDKRFKILINKIYK